MAWMAAGIERIAAKGQQNQWLTAILATCIIFASGCATSSRKVVQGTSASSHLTVRSTGDAPAKSSQSTRTVRQVGYLLDEDRDQSGDETSDGEYSNVEGERESDSSETQDVATPDIFAAMPPVIEQPYDLQSLIAQAVASHPSIAAARHKVASVSNRIPQATALDDPMFNNTFWPIQDQALQTAGGRIGHQFGLSQKVPWPTKLDARGAVAQREVQVARAEVAKAEREVVEAVRLAYYELWLADELIRIVEDNEELVSDLITVSEARYKAGGSQQDVLRAELEGDKLEDQLISLRRQKEQARADLGTLVRQPVHLMPTAFAELNVTETAPQLEVLVASAEQCNPTLQGLACLLYTSPSPRDQRGSRMPSSA